MIDPRSRYRRIIANMIGPVMLTEAAAILVVGSFPHWIVARTFGAAVVVIAIVVVLLASERP